MLAAFKIIAFLATTNGAASRAFYEDVLGLKFIRDDDFAIVFDANGMELRVQKVKALVPHPHTQLGWSVARIGEVVRALSTRGAVFERYPFLEQDALGIWVAPSGAKVAWLKDPDGNLLSLSEPHEKLSCGGET
jgi:catechol 2,3-dioxygenase-like lactoylglutathione lyase family enzyme